MVGYLNYELAVLDLIQSYIANPVLDKIMIFFTYMGEAGAVWIAIALIMLFSKKYRRYGITMILTLLAGLLIGNIILKPSIARIRPCDINTAVQLLIPRPLDFSFPSGHALSSFGAATVVFYANKKLGLLAYITASVIAFSRMYLYVHFPTDILAGMLIGIVIAVIINKLTQQYLRQKNYMKINRFEKKSKYHNPI